MYAEEKGKRMIESLSFGLGLGLGDGDWVGSQEDVIHISVDTNVNTW